ncbi:F0F1 ATP synthase subunit epsilon [Glycocaulis profundi]|nr:F0F1 ATP synthase subunit epsilon [Glycocaulis profundi]
MADKLQFDLVTPEARVFTGAVDMVVAPGSEGDFGVLPGHAPFMTTIRPGAIAIHDDGKVSRTFIHGGFAEVTPAGLTILAEQAIALADVDIAKVKAELEEARLNARDAASEADRRIAEAEVEKLEALIQAVETV